MSKYPKENLVWFNSTKYEWKYRDIDGHVCKGS